MTTFAPPATVLSHATRDAIEGDKGPRQELASDQSRNGKLYGGCQECGRGKMRMTITPPPPSPQRLLKHPRRLPARDQIFPLHHHGGHAVDPARDPQRLRRPHLLPFPSTGWRRVAEGGPTTGRGMGWMQAASGHGAGGVGARRWAAANRVPPPPPNPPPSRGRAIRWPSLSRCFKTRRHARRLRRSSTLS